MEITLEPERRALTLWLGAVCRWFAVEITLEPERRALTLWLGAVCRWFAVEIILEPERRVLTLWLGAVSCVFTFHHSDPFPRGGSFPSQSSCCLTVHTFHLSPY